MFSDLSPLYDHPGKVGMITLIIWYNSVISLYVVDFCDTLVGNLFEPVFLVILLQADILEQLMLNLEHSIKTTSQYPGR